MSMLEDFRANVLKCKMRLTLIIKAIYTPLHLLNSYVTQCVIQYGIYNMFLKRKHINYEARRTHVDLLSSLHAYGLLSYMPT